MGGSLEVGVLLCGSDLAQEVGAFSFDCCVFAVY